MENIEQNSLSFPGSSFNYIRAQRRTDYDDEIPPSPDVPRNGSFKSYMKHMYRLPDSARTSEGSSSQGAALSETDGKESLISINVNALKPQERERLRTILFKLWNPSQDEKGTVDTSSISDGMIRKALKIFNSIYCNNSSSTINRKTAQAFECLEKGMQLIDYRDREGNNPFIDKTTEGMQLYEKIRRRGLYASVTEPAAQSTRGMNLDAAAEVLRAQGFAGAGERFRQCAGQIQMAADTHRVDPYLITAVIAHESAFNAKAQSPCGARGLMQLMPGTAAEQGVQDAYNAYQNIMGGTKYLSKMLNTFSDTGKALAAYNAGPGNVQKYGGIPPFTETRNYVANISKLYSSLKEKVSRGLGKLIK